MADAVLPDGIEIEEPQWRMPAPGIVIGLAGAALAALLVVSGGTPGVPPTPDDTLPDLEVVDGGWSRLDLPGAGPLRAVAALGVADGYVAAGDGPQFWRSSDGLTWHLTDGPDHPFSVGGVEELRGSIVVVGSDTSTSGSHQPVIVTIDDAGTSRVIDLAGHEEAALEDVVAGAGRAMAWGWSGSPRDFTPQAEPLVVTSTDGLTWQELQLPDGMRVRAVRFDGTTWWVMGSRIGQPALFKATDVRQWTQVPTENLPFGWTMTDLRFGDAGLTAVALDQGQSETAEWRLEGDEWARVGEELWAGPSQVRDDAMQEIGLGFGRLWTRPADSARIAAWEDVGLEGEVVDLDGNVAVGGFGGQPSVWVRRSSGELASILPAPTGASWQLAANLGRGTVRGPWSVAGSWVVGTGEEWWLVTGSEVVPVPQLTGTTVERIDRVRDEWVAMPGMVWTSDGLSWEQRAEPWPEAAAGHGFVAGVAETPDGGALTVGLDQDRLWAVAASSDDGATWSLVADPAPTTPIRMIRALPDGFVAVAALPRNREAIMQSHDGIEWTELMEGEMLEGAEPPTVITPDGSLVLLDSGESVTVPRRAVTAVVRGPDGTVSVVAEGYLWTGGPDWTEVPLDPAHGLSGTDVRPLPGLDGLAVVAVDRGRVGIYRWEE